MLGERSERKQLGESTGQAYAGKGGLHFSRFKLPTNSVEIPSTEALDVWPKASDQIATGLLGSAASFHVQSGWPHKKRPSPLVEVNIRLRLRSPAHLCLSHA